MAINIHRFHLNHFDPLALYQSLCPQGPGLLESLNPLPKTGRFSIVPLRWQERYKLCDNQLYRCTEDKKVRLEGDPFARLAQTLVQRAVEPSLDTPFPGGYFGYFGYDLAAQIETLPRAAKRDLPIPELNLYWIDVTATYDHRNGQLTLATLDPEVDLVNLETAVTASQKPLKASILDVVQQPEAIINQSQFEQMVQQGKEYIASGDIYQVNLSCRFDGRVKGESAELYRRLRDINPSPFACLLHFPELDIISSSPERLVSL